MQFQIECNQLPNKSHVCLICDASFIMQEAQVLLCNEKGNSYGRVCPQCLSKGASWINSRFNQLTSRQLNPKAVLTKVK